MSDQGMAATELMHYFLDTVSILRATTTVAALVLKHPAHVMDTEKITATLAAVVIHGVENDHFDALGKKPSYISANPIFRSWEWVRLIAERCNKWVTQMVNHVDIQVAPSVQKDWKDVASTLEKMTNALACTLTSLEAYLNLYAEYTAKVSAESSPVKSSVTALDIAWDSYMSYAGDIANVAFAMFAQAGDVCEQTKTHFEVQKKLFISSKIVNRGSRKNG
jgi:hypothetical protein